MYLAKRMSNTSKFAVSDSKSKKDSFKGIFECMPKYVKKLKHLDFSIYKPEELSFYNQQVPKGKTVFDYLKYQPNQLETLKISSNQGSLLVLDSYRSIKECPSSLRKISIKNGAFIEPLEISLKHLKNLEEVEFVFNKLSGDSFIISVIELVPQLANLKALKLSFSHQFTPNLENALSKLKLLKDLKLLDVKFDSKARGFYGFFEMIQCFNLVNLRLSFMIDNDDELLQLKRCLSHLKQLESLRLEIGYNGLLRNNGSTIFLLREIDELLFLRNLSFSLRSWSLSIPQEDYLPEIQPIFKKLFEKAIALETFHFEVNQFKVSEPAYLNLLKSLPCSNLRRLGIILGKLSLRHDHQEEVLKFLERLENIRVVNLKGLEISDKKCFIGLIDVIMKFQNLRKLHLGEIQKNISPEDLVLGLKEILQKCGLRKFNCSLALELQAALRQENKDYLLEWSTSEFKEIHRKNPQLTSLPGFIDTEYFYYISQW